MKLLEKYDRSEIIKYSTFTSKLIKLFLDFGIKRNTVLYVQDII